MPLEDTKTIDIISRDALGFLNLVVTDSGNTQDQERRFELLLEKFTTYLRYIFSDEFSGDHPQSSHDSVRIKVMCANPPTDKMKGISEVSHPNYQDYSIPVIFEVFEDRNKPLSSSFPTAGDDLKQAPVSDTKGTVQQFDKFKAKEPLARMFLRFVSAPILFFMYNREALMKRGEWLFVNRWIEGPDEVTFYYFLVPGFKHGTVTIHRNLPSITVSRRGSFSYSFDYSILNEPIVRFTEQQQLVLESKDSDPLVVCRFNAFGLFRFVTKLRMWHKNLRVDVGNKTVARPSSE